jgi:hypothetical protein
VTRPFRSLAALAGLALALPAVAFAQAPPPASAPPPPPKAEEAPAPAFKISGLVFGDYYYVAQSHRDDLVGQNGFWIRRLYFTYDHTLSKAFSVRVRLEANSKGDFKSTGVNTPASRPRRASTSWTRSRATATSRRVPSTSTAGTARATWGS